MSSGVNGCSSGVRGFRNARQSLADWRRAMLDSMSMSKDVTDPRSVQVLDTERGNKNVFCLLFDQKLPVLSVNILQGVQQ